MALQNIRQKSAAAAAVIGLGALLVGCSTDARNAASASVGGTGTPALVVSCEPSQRAVVRQVAVNGGLQPQVQCETVAPALAPVGTTGSFGAVNPVAYQPGFQPVAYAPTPVSDTRIG